MRVLVVEPGPHFSVQDVCNGWVSGLTDLGATVVQYNHNDRLLFYEAALRQPEMETNPDVWDQRKGGVRTEATQMAAKGIEAAMYEVWPDVVVFISGFFVPTSVYQLARARGHKVVLVCTESPYQDMGQMQLAPFADVVLINDPQNIDKFRALNPNTYYVPHAYNPKVHCPGPAIPEMKTDFAFVGSAFPSRIEFLESVDWHGADIGLAGQWHMLEESSPLHKYVMHDLDDCLPNEQTVDVYRSTKASANIYRREGDVTGVQGWAMGPREVELAATGTFFLRDPRAEGDEVLPMLPTFDGPGDFSDKLQWWLQHDTERERVTEQAREAIAQRTFVENAKMLLRHLFA